MIKASSIIWSFRNRLDELKRSIQSADKTCDKSIEFHLVDAASEEKSIQEVRSFCSSIPDRKIRICECSYRSSLSEAWNLAMMTTDCRYAIFSSSDVNFLKAGWHEDIMENMKNGCQYVLIQGHSVFGFDKKAIPLMGWFDEKFVIGPHFDCDFMIRASEKGIRLVNIANQGYYTHVGLPGSYMERIKNPLENYLPMNDFTNEYVFKEKWLSSWPGWKSAFEQNLEDVPHPPTNITQVARLKPEIDQHPSYTKKYT